MTEKENELRAEIEVAGNPETRALPSNSEEDEPEELKETAMEQKHKMGAKKQGRW